MKKLLALTLLILSGCGDDQSTTICIAEETVVEVVTVPVDELGAFMADVSAEGGEVVDTSDRNLDGTVDVTVENNVCTETTNTDVDVSNDGPITFNTE